MTTQTFIPAIKSSLIDHTFVKFSLGHYKGSEPSLKNITARKITIKGQEKLSFTYRYKTKDIVKNFNTDEALSKINEYLKHDFKAAALFTTGFDLTLEKGSVKKKPPSHTETQSADHDRAKKRHVTTQGKLYLHTLGITDEKGNVLKTAQDKYRQIDKYVEILGGLIKNLPKDAVKNIADMGAGKGYLTFALYDYLVNMLHMEVNVIGVEMRPELVNLCNRISTDQNFTSLNFAEGTIKDYDASNADILIALHACDTATDDAIDKGIKAGAELIVVAPCCHKQIRREMEGGKISNPLTPLTRHGIFLERQAEMVTDTIRALILEHFGYTVKVFEFIGGEHTPKNVMIVAIKTVAKSPDALTKAQEIKEFFGISSHALEGLSGI